MDVHCIRSAVSSAEQNRLGGNQKPQNLSILGSSVSSETISNAQVRRAIAREEQ